MASWVAMGPAKGRDVDQAELRLRLSASLDEARRELIDATERGEGGRAALARSRRVHRRHHPRARRQRARADTGAARRLRGRRVRPQVAVPPFRHRSAHRLRRADRPARGALRQGAAAPAVGPAVPGRAPRARDRRFRSSRHDESRISARAHGPSAARRRPRSHRSGSRPS